MDIQTVVTILFGILTLLFGGVATWSWRKDQGVKDALEVVHGRISKTKQECSDNHKESLKEISVARTECYSAVAAARSEFQDRMSATDAKTDTSISRIHNRIDEIKRDMVTHDDARVHFTRIEESLGKSFDGMRDMISNLNNKVDAISQCLPRLDERIKTLEKD